MVVQREVMMKKINSFKIAVQILWKSSKKFFVLTFAISIFSVIPSVLNLVVWKKILDLIYDFLMGKSVNYYFVMICILMHFFLSLLSDVLSKYSFYIQSIYTLLVQQFITNETINAVMCMDLMDLENSEIHNIVDKANGQSCERMMALLGKLVEFTKNVATFIGMSSILISFNFILYIIIFASVVPIALYNRKYYSKIYEMYDNRYEKLRYSNELKQIISKSEFFKELKLFNSISYLQEKINMILDEMVSEERKARKKLNTQGTRAEIFQMCLTYILKGAIIIIGMRFRYSIGTINMNMESATSVQGSISNIIMSLIAMHEDCMYLDGFSELINIKKRKLESENSGEKKIADFDIKTIELKNVWFRYGEDKEFVIKDFSYKFVIGKSYAVVGYNGSGKTTLIKIILGLYKPQKGVVLVNGKSIDRYEIKEYYKKISAVFQDFARYPLTIRENIGMGNYEMSDDIEKIKAAAKSACSEEFIASLPNQYEEKLIRGWKDSVDLSIGQWQRIAIARANIRAGNVAIFDEPSASLDAKTENRILNQIIINKRDKIGILITHRFLNIKKVDEIIVLKEGTLENQGIHEELLKSSDIYRELYNSQKEMI